VVTARAYLEGSPMKDGDVITIGNGLRLRSNGNGTWTDQHGRLLEQYTNEKGEPDFRPTGGVDPKGANH
jgi:hypothetical protein